MPGGFIKASDGVVMLSAGWSTLIVSMTCTDSQAHAYQEMQQDRDFTRIG